MTRVYFYIILLIAVVAVNRVYYPIANAIIPESDVKLMFSYEGCKVYRFKVASPSNVYADHYFTNCKGSTIDVEDNNKFQQILTEKE
jgi:hypothetical protein